MKEYSKGIYVKFKPEDVVVLTISGRGDKDMETYIKYKLKNEK